MGEIRKRSRKEQNNKQARENVEALKSAGKTQLLVGSGA